MRSACARDSPPPRSIAPVGRAGVSLRKTGPAAIAVGGTATYRIEIWNPGDLPTRDALLTDEIPDTFSYVSSSPPGEVLGKRIQWRLGNLAPGQRQCVELSFRAVQAGSVANCAQVTAAGGITATNCVTTTVSPPPPTTRRRS